jgi:hypothetical protein
MFSGAAATQDVDCSCRVSFYFRDVGILRTAVTISQKCPTSSRKYSKFTGHETIAHEPIHECRSPQLSVNAGYMWQRPMIDSSAGRWFASNRFSSDSGKGCGRQGADLRNQCFYGTKPTSPRSVFVQDPRGADFWPLAASLASRLTGY